MTRYKVIANPAAGRGRARQTILRTLELLKEKGAVFDLELTTGPGEAADAAKRACSEFDVIVAVGGDGTVNEIVPGMLFSGKPLGVVPGGSGNDFVKNLNIPNSIEKAVDIILAGRTRVVDAGLINGRYFANGVGIGFDAAVTRKSHRISHRQGGIWLYICALVRTLGTYDAVPMKISMNGSTIEQETFLLTVGNGTTCGGVFRLTPDARIDDQQLDVTMIKPMGTARLLWHLPKVFRGTIGRVTRYARLDRAPKLTVEAARPVPVHVDGEMFGEGTRYEIEIVPNALTVIGDFRSDDE